MYIWQISRPFLLTQFIENASTVRLIWDTPGFCFRRNVSIGLATTDDFLKCEIDEILSNIHSFLQKLKWSNLYQARPDPTVYNSEAFKYVDQPDSELQYKHPLLLKP